jgi:regulatory protein
MILKEVALPTITKLESQKKNNNRISVYVDDKFFCGLSIDDMVKNSIVSGMEVTDEFLSNLLGTAGENDMYNKALVYILTSPRTELEIKRFLSRKKDCSPDMTARIIDRLKTSNYIDDEAYARMFTTAKHVKASARAIKLKLRQKGISSEYVAQATQDIGDQSDLARSVAEKYMRYKEYDQKNLQKLYAYLVGKGFEYDNVTAIISEYKSKKEIDPETKKVYNESQEEYRRAKEQLRKSHIEARQKKRSFKAIKKKIVSEVEGK